MSTGSSIVAATVLDRDFAKRFHANGLASNEDKLQIKIHSDNTRINHIQFKLVLNSPTALHQKVNFLGII